MKTQIWENMAEKIYYCTQQQVWNVFAFEPKEYINYQ